MTKRHLTRSQIMSRVRGKDTRPEMRVRSLAHRIGYRFRLHRRDLPGSPDLVFPMYRTCIFVHGCFWHRHVGCKRTTTPKTRVNYWSTKFQENIARDERVKFALEQLGWKVVVVWECQTDDESHLEDLLLKSLG